jgi:hypothetical protein
MDSVGDNDDEACAFLVRLGKGSARGLGVQEAMGIASWSRVAVTRQSWSEGNRPDVDTHPEPDTRAGSGVVPLQAGIQYVRERADDEREPRGIEAEGESVACVALEFSAHFSQAGGFQSVMDDLGDSPAERSMLRRRQSG